MVLEIQATLEDPRVLHKIYKNMKMLEFGVFHKIYYPYIQMNFICPYYKAYFYIYRYHSS